MEKANDGLPLTLLVYTDEKFGVLTLLQPKSLIFKKNRGPMKHNHMIRLGILCGLVILLIFAVNFHKGKSAASPEATVKQAYQKALKIGEYNFATTVEQTTTPLPLQVNTGSNARVDTLYIEGETNLSSNTMLLRLWQNGGNVLSTDSSLEFKVVNGIAYGKKAFSNEWQEVDNFSDVFAPGGNVLAFLVGAKNIQEINF